MSPDIYRYPTWEVKLSVDGPIKTIPIQSFKVLKGFQQDDPFYSDISIKNVQYGVVVSVTAFASNSNLAREAALLFIGKMLDALSLILRLPLFLSFTETFSNRKYKEDVKRIIEKNEWLAVGRRTDVDVAEPFVDEVSLDSLGPGVDSMMISAGPSLLVNRKVMFLL